MDAKLCDLFADLFFFNVTATTEIYTLALHDELPIYLFADLFAELFADLFAELFADLFAELFG